MSPFPGYSCGCPWSPNEEEKTRKKYMIVGHVFLLLLFKCGRVWRKQNFRVWICVIRLSLSLSVCFIYTFNQGDNNSYLVVLGKGRYILIRKYMYCKWFLSVCVCVCVQESPRTVCLCLCVCVYLLFLLRACFKRKRALVDSVVRTTILLLLWFVFLPSLSLSSINRKLWNCLHSLI